MTMEDYEDLYPLRQPIVHRLTEQEKNKYADKKIAEFLWGSRKQWRTVMMIETNTYHKFFGTTYGDLHNFIAMYIDEAIESQKPLPYMDGDWHDSEDSHVEDMVDDYFNRY